MRIATRNIHQGGPKDFSALRKTLALLEPDILFLQECCAPQRYKGWLGYQAYWHGVGHGRWGSATFVREGIYYEPLEPVSVDFAGWINAGVVTVANREINLLNIHTPTTKNRSYVLLALDVLASFGPCIAQHPTILGGDWNVTIATDEANTIDLKGSRSVRDSLSKIGLVNAWRHLHPDKSPPRTLRHHFRTDSAPHHIDGFFLTPDLLPHLHSCEVLETEDWLDSDHNPVVMEMQL